MSHWNRWHNTRSTILTSKLDLPQPGGAAATWLRSCQESVRLRTDFGFVLPHFLGGRLGRAGESLLMTWTLNSESGLRSGRVESHFPRLTRHDLIEAESPAFDGGHNPPTPELLTPANNRLHGQLMDSLPIWSFNFLKWHRFLKATMNVAVHTSHKIKPT